MIWDNKKIEQVARICHAANRAYCQTIGDDSIAIWECTSKQIRESATIGVQAIVNNPKLTSKESHELWCETKIKHGWKHGPVKHEFKKEHPCLVPYDKLPEAQKIKDKIFGNIVRSFLEEVK